MSKFDVVLFDFDGTVADTSPGIKEALSYTFKVCNLPNMTDKEMDRFIGPPLNDSFVKYCGVTEERANEMIGIFRGYYHTIGIDKFIIYSEIERAIKILKEKGIVVAIATSKPEIMAIHILEKSGLYPLFDVIQGATLDGKLVKKADIIEHVLKKDGIKNKSVLMVGDTEFDIIGAHKNNVPALWVNYGFGTKTAALAESPEYMADTQEDMVEFFKKL
ncbi:MAG: HAD hydrolase-like protein [Clostridia bacterium]